MQDEKKNIDFYESTEPTMGELLNLALSLHYEMKELKEILKNIQSNSKPEPPTPVSRKPIVESYTTEEVKTMLNVSDRTLYSYRKNGILPAKKVGGKYLYRKVDVETLLC